MPKASVKRSIECSKNKLIDLVLDIEKYPIFVPFCIDAKIHEKKEQHGLLLIVASSFIGKILLRFPFTVSIACSSAKLLLANRQRNIMRLQMHFNCLRLSAQPSGLRIVCLSSINYYPLG